MSKNSTFEYGIKYFVSEISEGRYLMIPVGLVEGLSDGITFSTDNESLPICYSKNDLAGKFVVDNVFTSDDLEEMYDHSGDISFLKDYFFDDYKNEVYIADIGPNGQVLKYVIDLSKFDKKEFDLTFHMLKDASAITLNEDALNELLNHTNSSEAKVILNKYKSLLGVFDKKKKGVTTVNFKNGEVVSVETEKKIKDVPVKVDVSIKKPLEFGGFDITYSGLRDYIKGRVFGHDDEIDVFAQKMYMNYTANDDEEIESIL